MLWLVDAFPLFSRIRTDGHKQFWSFRAKELSEQVGKSIKVNCKQSIFNMMGQYLLDLKNGKTHLLEFERKSKVEFFFCQQSQQFTICCETWRTTLSTLCTNNIISFTTRFRSQSIKFSIYRSAATQLKHAKQHRLRVSTMDRRICATVLINQPHSIFSTVKSTSRSRTSHRSTQFSTTTTTSTRRRRQQIQ